MMRQSGLSRRQEPWRIENSRFKKKGENVDEKNVSNRFLKRAASGLLERRNKEQFE